MVIVILGPMGCGKTTIGRLLATKLGWQFLDADDFHPESNRAKMARGIPLDDQDRLPWLNILHQEIRRSLATDSNMVLACSALKKQYRKQLGINQQQVVSVFLKGSFELLQSRISGRSHEFMPRDMLQSQLDTLEEPETVLIVDIAGSKEQICRTIRDYFSL